MKKFKKYSLIGLVLVLLFTASYFVGMRKGQVEAEPEITSRLISNRLERASQLVASKYYYTNTGTYSNQNYFYGWKVPFTGKNFVLIFDGEISMGSDLSKLDVKIDNKKIDISYEAAKIIGHEIKEDSIKVIDVKNSIFNPIKIEDYAEFSTDQKEKVEKEAIENGLLVEANKHIEETIKEILFLDENIRENYNIEFLRR